MKTVLIIALAALCAQAQARDHDDSDSHNGGSHHSHSDFDSRWDRTQRDQERDRYNNSDRLCEDQSSGCRGRWSYRK